MKIFIFILLSICLGFGQPLKISILNDRVLPYLPILLEIERVDSTEYSYPTLDLVTAPIKLHITSPTGEDFYFQSPIIGYIADPSQVPKQKKEINELVISKTRFVADQSGELFYMDIILSELLKTY